MNQKKKEIPEFEAAVIQLMQEPWGRVLFFRILEACEVDKSFPVEDHAKLAAFMGRRSLGLELREIAQEFCPREYNLGASEQLTRAAARATTQEPTEDQNG